MRGDRKKQGDVEILTHLSLYEKRGNPQASPMPIIDYTERVEIVPYDDGWQEYEERVYDFLKVLNPSMNTSARNNSELVEK